MFNLLLTVLSYILTHFSLCYCSPLFPLSASVAACYTVFLSAPLLWEGWGHFMLLWMIHSPLWCMCLDWKMKKEIEGTVGGCRKGKWGDRKENTAWGGGQQLLKLIKQHKRFFKLFFAWVHIYPLMTVFSLSNRRFLKLMFSLFLRSTQSSGC